MRKSKREKIIMVHFQPLELYPPAMNMIDFLKNEAAVILKVISNRKSSKNKLTTYDPGQGVKVYRTGFQFNNNLLRYAGYFSYYLSALFLLLWHRPQTVLYVETLSSWPAMMYKKIRGKKVKLMAHYHEYTDPVHYKDGMALSRWLHSMESKMFRVYSWISHTNIVRMEMFKNDENLNAMAKNTFHIMPNYPSKNWITKKIKDSKEQNIRKMVFVGSLGYQDMYLQEIINWVETKQGEFSIDFYAYNIQEKARKLIENSRLKNIKYCGGCDYKSLPQILKNYDIGLVIYKPFSENTIHAVSNKVFEYLACGLDVWFSEDMTYTFKYIKENTFPKILPVDFKNLAQFDYQAALSREEINYEPSHYYYETIYPEMLGHVLMQKEGGLA